MHAGQRLPRGAGGEIRVSRHHRRLPPPRRHHGRRQHRLLHDVPRRTAATGRPAAYPVPKDAVRRWRPQATRGVPRGGGRDGLTCGPRLRHDREPHDLPRLTARHRRPTGPHRRPARPPSPGHHRPTRRQHLRSRRGGRGGRRRATTIQGLQGPHPGRPRIRRTGPVPYWRPGRDAPRRPRVRHRTGQGHHHPQRREHLG